MTFTQFLRRIGGTALFVVGVISLVLPVLPGLLLIALAFYILSIDSPRMHEYMHRLRVRFRVFDTAMHAVERRLHRKVKSITDESL